jgi:hypothetical protein
LAGAQGRAAAASAASGAKTVVEHRAHGHRLGTFGYRCRRRFAGIKSFQDQVGRSGELNKFAEGLRLTDSQIEAAGGKVKYLADRTREITGLTVSFGDVAKATFQILAERAGITRKEHVGRVHRGVQWIGGFGKFTIALLLAGFAALVEVAASSVKNLGRIATGKFDKLTNPLKDMKNQFFKTFAT